MTNKEAVRAFVASRGLVNVRNSNGTIYSINNVIYSYGHHYPAAAISATENIVWVNSARYSNTTSKHMGLIKREAEARGFKVVLTDKYAIEDMKKLQDWVMNTPDEGRV